jgi:hypothetical protein
MRDKLKAYLQHEHPMYQHSDRKLIDLMIWTPKTVSTIADIIILTVENKWVHGAEVRWGILNEGRLPKTSNFIVSFK